MTSIKDHPEAGTFMSTMEISGKSTKVSFILNKEESIYVPSKDLKNHIAAGVWTKSWEIMNLQIIID